METTFDALGYVRQMEKAGENRQIAEAQAEALQKAFASYDSERSRELATKGDLRESGLQLRVEMQGIRVEMQAMENRLRNWFIGTTIAIIAALIGAAGAIIGYMPK